MTHLCQESLTILNSFRNYLLNHLTLVELSESMPSAKLRLTELTRMPLKHPTTQNRANFHSLTPSGTRIFADCHTLDHSINYFLQPIYANIKFKTINHGNITSILHTILSVLCVIWPAPLPRKIFCGGKKIQPISWFVDERKPGCVESSPFILFIENS